MASAENAKLEFEAGQTPFLIAALTAGTDLTTFTSSSTLWSSKAGSTPVIRPNGLLTGGTIVPSVAGGNNTVDVSALTCNLNGVVTSVSNTTNVAITRPATAVAKVNSITINAAGAIAVIAGTDSGSTTFSETRGVAGGPPLIPVDSIEIGQVRVISNTAAAITTAQIFTVAGVHTETANFPLYDINYNGGSITFLSALPAIHTGTVPKRVFASYSAPIFAPVSLASDFTAPENAHSTSSTQIYGTTIGTTSTSLGQGSFTAYLDDGITDNLVTQKDNVLWFRFYPDRFKSAYILCQGKLGIARTFPAGNEIQAACTISAKKPAVGVAQ